MRDPPSSDPEALFIKSFKYDGIRAHGLNQNKVSYLTFLFSLSRTHKQDNVLPSSFHYQELVFIRRRGARSRTA